jgi:hypothetical protein
MKNYINNIVDLTGESYLNPVGAAYGDGTGTHQRNVNQITSISIHHDASQRPHDYDSVARYRQEAAQHYNRLGPGLQYHYKIDNTGAIFKIRPLTTWLYAVGSAENVTTIAICLDGYFHPPYNEKPTREQYEALGQLLVNLCEQHPEFPATYPDVRPHRDFSATSCPGDNLAPWVFAIQSKNDVLNIPSDAVYDWPSEQPAAPAPTPAPIEPTVTVNYRVFKGGKQIGAYSLDTNAWNKYKVEHADVIKDQNGNDVTVQLLAKFSPPPTPAPTDDHTNVGPQPTPTPIPNPTPTPPSDTELALAVRELVKMFKEFLARFK